MTATAASNGVNSRFPAGTFRPAPGAGSRTRMLLAHARTETRLTLRNGEQILLTLLIPIALLVGLTLIDIISLPEPRVDSVVPRVFALAVMSSAFTGQAIALGFDRRYGVLKRLAATALPRWMLAGGRVLAGLTVVAIQLIVLGVVALALGWSPSLGGVLWTVLLAVLGALAFGALGVLLGGSLRAEIVLALANIIWFVLLLAGGIIVRAGSMPSGVAGIVELLPSGALTEGVDLALNGGGPGWQPLVVLVGWGAVAAVVAARTTRLT
ncbi:ABC-2 type transport system permease protein [Kibdelosporangium phytohabitans]|uniref:Multidrug ABC transporter permease n=2 Tax=Kibdelosporangium phytohabitans TaxID=860235 RepID=A0A0N7F4J4_9PSEU|nr:multidrug ABC transporter permease [Kibdelosporangium phytohabitans]MBE1462970.1 ABC-2 type transport system permease protein [Kibdelosporangium phytohabitans]